MEYIKVILSALLSAGMLFIIAKLMGHKQMSQLYFFDYITGITIGSIAAELATELEKPLKPLIAMVVYGSVAIGLSFLTSRFPKSRKFVNGSPTILMNDGKLYRKNMKKAKIDLSEFMVMCRQEGYFDLAEIQTAIFEYNGRLTVLPVSTKRPLNPEDMNLAPKEAHISTEIIMDGQILEENLKRKGLNLKWLENQLREQGYHSAKNVFLALCDADNKLTLYSYN
ncbi:MAG: DUF421 domain-containing protein [Clostridia bacterium]|nr:DUF421 domain-containing protein [Clostridia bacterium]